MANRILIVDDDPKSQVLLRDLLKANGYATLEACDGKQAVEMAKREKPDLILMDYHMPVLNGLEATRLIKTDDETRDIPVIFVTSSAMKGDEDKIYASGCEAYISKPFDIHKLLGMIAKFVGL
mgnify:CR=1 FL=1